MKAIMYHYVRPSDAGLPHFRYLHHENFEKQLEYFDKKYGFVSKEEYKDFIENKVVPKGVILTFDDGLKDHYEYVFKTLLERGLWGVFFVTTGIYQSEKLLDVHKIHYILGKLGGNDALQLLVANIKPEMLIEKDISAFKGMTYHSQSNSWDTKKFKHCLNYEIDPKFRAPLLEQLFKEIGLNENAIFKKFYLSKSEIKKMYAHGMKFGSHTKTHTVMSKLSIKEQNEEVQNSKSFLGELLESEIEEFAYPYGGFHTFSNETEKMLSKNDVKVSWNVETRDVNQNDIIMRPQALPRYDCNLFPYGKAHYGTKSDEQI